MNGVWGSILQSLPNRWFSTFLYHVIVSSKSMVFTLKRAFSTGGRWVNYVKM